MTAPLPMPKVSVIVPVYKVERYVEQCVRSLMAQTLEEIEVIFVDDSSPDSSMEIINRILATDPNFKTKTRIIRHERNRGLAATRITAIAEAKGRYILPCDSDDYVEPDYCKALYEKAEATGADITVCDFNIVSESSTTLSPQPVPSDPLECIDASLRGRFTFNVWNKLIRRQLLTTPVQAFEEGVDMWEDVIAMCRLYLRCRSVAHVGKPLYNYRAFRAGSYSRRLPRRSLEQMAHALDLAESCFRSAGFDDRFGESLQLMRVGLKYNMLLHSSGREQRSWLAYHPEIDRRAFDCRALPMTRRLHFWLATHGFLPLFNSLRRNG